MPGNYTIISSQLPLVGGTAGHNLVVVLDPSGHVMHEFDGLATGANGQIKPIGYLPSDTLKVYDFTSATYYNSSQAHYTLFQSPDINAIDQRIGALQDCMNQINAANLSYPFMGLGKNSNSVDSTLIACIGGTEIPMPGGAHVMPGVGDILLSQDTINAVKALNGISQNFVELDDTGTQFDNSWPTPDYGDEFGNFG